MKNKHNGIRVEMLRGKIIAKAIVMRKKKFSRDAASSIADGTARS
jgi:hypothetical protein